MDEQASKINYGLIIAGLTGAFWGYYEYSKKDNSDNPSHLQDIVIPTNTYCEENDHKLIYTSGSLHTSNPSPLKDDLFGVSVDALKLRRHVEMLQWKQERNNVMKLKWSKHSINSEKFLANFANPSWNLPRLDISVNGNLEVNGYIIGNNALNKVNSWKTIQGGYTGKDLKEEKIDGSIVLHKHSKKFYTPKAGNYRVTHEYVPTGGVVSVLGMQIGKRIVPYKGKVMMVKEGVVTADEMIQEYGNKKSFYIWFTRTVCFLGIGGGLFAAFHK